MTLQNIEYQCFNNMFGEIRYWITLEDRSNVTVCTHCSGSWTSVCVLHARTTCWIREREGERILNEIQGKWDEWCSSHNLRSMHVFHACHKLRLKGLSSSISIPSSLLSVACSSIFNHTRYCLNNVTWWTGIKRKRMKKIAGSRSLLWSVHSRRAWTTTSCPAVTCLLFPGLKIPFAMNILLETQGAKVSSQIEDGNCVSRQREVKIKSIQEEERTPSHTFVEALRGQHSINRQFKDSLKGWRSSLAV